MIDIERQSERLIRRLKLPDDVADLKIRIPHKAVEVGGRNGSRYDVNWCPLISLEVDGLRTGEQARVLLKEGLLAGFSGLERTRLAMILVFPIQKTWEMGFSELEDMIDLILD